SGARVVAILRAEVLVDGRGVLVHHAAEAGEGLAGLGLAVARQPDGLGLGIAGPVFAARLGLLAIAADLVARLGTEGGGAGAGFLERRVEARLRLVAICARGDRGFGCAALRSGGLRRGLARPRCVGGSPGQDIAFRCPTRARSNRAPHNANPTRRAPLGSAE